MGWDWTASTMPWYWMGLDGIGDDGNGDAKRLGWQWRWRCVVMQYDALPWDWLGWDGDDGGGGGGDADAVDVIRCVAMRCRPGSTI